MGSRRVEIPHGLSIREILNRFVSTPDNIISIRDFALAQVAQRDGDFWGERIEVVINGHQIAGVRADR